MQFYQTLIRRNIKKWHRDYDPHIEDQLHPTDRSLSLIIPLNDYRRLLIHPVGCDEQMIVTCVGQVLIIDSSLLHCGFTNDLRESSVCVHMYAAVFAGAIPDDFVFN